ncbi:hypothetical protein RND71_005619 [Anisodus tanguticus]|uniref:Exocyst subunit Exo70 family protein n=1 Tax=Anisodus tanguticus TaxID=243964 RepID=A0AAE1STF0_9SOLA|nr:hypothetical protein RND71_005619 [Anisodus tanguticus]
MKKSQEFKNCKATALVFLKVDYVVSKLMEFGRVMMPNVGSTANVVSSGIVGEFYLAEEDYHKTPIDTNDDSFTKELDHQESITSSYRSTNSIREVDLILSEAIYDLRCITELMISTGCLRDCIQVIQWRLKEVISISRRSLEKLFNILDLHDALSHLLPNIEIIFESKSSESIRVQVVEILSKVRGDC